MKTETRTVPKRAAALLHTLVVATLIAVVAFCVSTSVITQLSLSSRYAQRAQSDFVAKAAAQELLAEMRQLPLPSRLDEVPTPLLRRLPQREWVLTPSPRLPARVRLVRERCVDNSNSPHPCPSQFGSRVPPFSVSLALEVFHGPRVANYEVLIQQRWPYVLAAPGPIVVSGALQAANFGFLPNFQLRQASLIEGRILALGGNAVEVDPMRPLALNPILFSLLYSFGASGMEGNADRENRVHVGGQLRLVQIATGGSVGLPGSGTGTSGTGDSGGGPSPSPQAAYQQNVFFPPVTTEGAQVIGGVDMLENQEPAGSPPEVKVSPGNLLTGTVRKNHRLTAEDPLSLEARQHFGELLDIPDSQAWPEYAYGAAAGLDLNRSNVPGGRARLVRRLGADPAPVRLGSATVTLNEVEVAVQDDFVLSGCRLQGSGSSLIVDGTLLIDGGELDAGDNGLVIYCRRLIMRTQGHFKGLIIAQQGATFYGGAEDRLSLEGGLVVGANSLSASPGFAVPGGRSIDRSLDVRSLVLSSTELRYSPKYLRSLNRLGGYSLLGVEHRP